jgi:outer membrane protein TolC
MDRIGRLTIIFATVSLPCFEPLVCRAQFSASPPSTTPPVQQTTTKAKAGDEPRTPRKSKAHVPPPRTESATSAAVTPPVSIPPPRPWTQPADRPPTLTRATGSPAVDPAVIRGAQDTPQPLPSEPQTPGQPQTARDLLKTQLKPAPLESSDVGFPINLATALRLSDARPLIVAAAQASVIVAEAQLTRAKVIWVPTLVFGADYIRHDGGGPDFNKGVLTAPSVNYFYAGGGLNLSNSGLFEFVNLTDAYFQPLVVRQVLNSRQWDIQTAKNDALLLTADAYFRVHQHRGMYTGALYCVERGQELVKQVASLSKELVPIVEVERARNLLAHLEQLATSERQAWRVHSANLTRVLRLNPQAVVVPLEHDHLQLTLIDPATPLADLQQTALVNRPDLASKRALVQAGAESISREKMRPFLPIVVLGGFQNAGGMMTQAGIFGLGPNSSLNQWTGRADVSIQLVWQFDALGIGNLARIKQQRGNQSQAIVQLNRTQDAVAAEVMEAYANLQSAAARVGQADRSLRTALTAYNGNVEGLRQTTRFGDTLVLVYRPQEVIYALRLLKLAFDEYFTTVADYNRAEFELFHALGYPASEITYLKPPGQLAPVDTDRPNYLPPVGNGPPPATR